MGGVISKKTHDKLTDPLKLIPDKYSDPLRLFGGPASPATTAAASVPSAPTINSNSVQLAAEEEARKRNNAGRASTIFAGSSDSGTTTGASRLFLGAGV